MTEFPSGMQTLQPDGTISPVLPRRVSAEHPGITGASPKFNITKDSHKLLANNIDHNDQSRFPSQTYLRYFKKLVMVSCRYKMLYFGCDNRE